MNILYEQPIRRIATFGFDAPAQINVPSSLSYTDTDTETGEESRIPIIADAGRGSHADIFHAILNTVLIELSHELQVNPGDPPIWVPTIDDSLDTHLRLLDRDLYDRLRMEVCQEAALPQGGERLTSPKSNSVFHIPKLLSEIALVLVEVELDGGVRKRFFDPDENALDRLVSEVVNRVKQSLDCVDQLFGTDIADPRFVTIESRFFETSDICEPIGNIEDLIVATAISWITNLMTSSIKPVGPAIGFWLADRDGKRVSRTVGFGIQSGEGAIRFDLSLSPRLGRSELNRVNPALRMLVGLNTARQVIPKRQKKLLDADSLVIPDALAM
jgi:hypothetical protein